MTKHYVTINRLTWTHEDTNKLVINKSNTILSRDSLTWWPTQRKCKVQRTRRSLPPFCWLTNKDLIFNSDCESVKWPMPICLSSSPFSSVFFSPPSAYEIQPPLILQSRLFLLQTIKNKALQAPGFVVAAVFLKGCFLKLLRRILTNEFQRFISFLF